MTDAAIPRVSWLLCTHLATDQCRAAIQSCLDQNFEQFELLVVCNGPHADDIAHTIESWFDDRTRLRVLRTPIPQLTFSLNLGLHAARAPLIARMDSDDLAHADRLTEQVNFLEQHPGIHVLGSAYVIIDGQDREVARVQLPAGNAAIRRALFWRNPLCHPAVMFRRDCVLAVGGYLGTLHAEDYDLWSRLAGNPSIGFANLPLYLTRYRQTGVGEARGARLAYAGVAGSQLRNFANGQGWRWLLACGVSLLKSALKAKRR